MYTGTNDSLQPHVNNLHHPHVHINIKQSMGKVVVDGLSMCLTCIASVISSNSSYHINMNWSGEGLHSLWVNQLKAETRGNITTRKLCFYPWLNSQPEEYTCHVTVRDNDNLTLTMSKITTVNGMCFEQ